jgi:hypothetical protein
MIEKENKCNHKLININSVMRTVEFNKYEVSMTGTTKEDYLKDRDFLIDLADKGIRELIRVKNMNNLNSKKAPRTAPLKSIQTFFTQDGKEMNVALVQSFIGSLSTDMIQKIMLKLKDK